MPIKRTALAWLMLGVGSMDALEQMNLMSPNQPLVDGKKLVAAAAACAECELACLACADACLGESDLAALRTCVSLDLVCGDLCGVTSRILSRRFEMKPETIRSLLENCAWICVLCGAECHEHGAQHAHCEVCADACKLCEISCRALLRELDALPH
jgi:hypothetical protein